MQRSLTALMPSSDYCAFWYSAATVWMSTAVPAAQERQAGNPLKQPVKIITLGYILN